MIQVPCGTCIWCGQPATLYLDEAIADKALLYMQNRSNFGLVQDEFPTLRPWQREMLMNGSHDECFNEMFPEDD